MKQKLILLSILILGATAVFAQFQLPRLQYGYNALEPYIDAETMRIHYNNHHATYVNNLNNALKDHLDLQRKSVEDLIRDLSAIPADMRTAVRNNGGGHYNHTLFWANLAPAGTANMSEKMRRHIEKDFGSVEAFKQEFEKAATGRFGSGWAWLVKDNNGKLRIVSTPNQDNPIMSVAEVSGKPLLGLDVWEHAYYLKYQSKRADYIKAFWEVVNWKEVEKRMNEK